MGDFADSVRTEVLTAAAYLRPELQREIEHLYAANDELLERATENSIEIAELKRQLHATTVRAGDLHQRLASAERRLEDLAVDQIQAARRDALWLGDGFVRITSRGRGNFETNRVPPDRIVVRGA